jgi:hypothetical protein
MAGNREFAIWWSQRRRQPSITVRAPRGILAGVAVLSTQSLLSSVRPGPPPGRPVRGDGAGQAAERARPALAGAAAAELRPNAAARP